MADAMCGPSNPLQQFKQQSDIDRSLQQDRFTSRQHPAQGFRSQDPNGALLDPEFEAFQAGVEPPVLDHAPPFQRPAGFGGPSQAPSWANDFQQMHISSPPPMQQPVFQQASNTSNWAQGFREQFAQAAPKSQSSSSPLAFQQRARGFGNYGFQNSFAQQPYAPAVQSKGKAPVLAEQFDEAAFERAFDQAREDMMQDVEQEPVQEDMNEELAEKVEAATESEATRMLNETARDMDEQSIGNIIHRIHSTDIEYRDQDIMQEEQTEERQQHEDDALAATAQELLEKVQHNKSDKFQNSQFLGLMRKLRDREVRVEGDKMVETANASSTPTADDTLNDSSTNSQRVYYGKPQPAPLAMPVDTRPAENSIPPYEQDHDPGRIDPRDGQAVVDLLNAPGPITEDMGSPPPPDHSKPWPAAKTHRTAAGCFFKDDMDMEDII